MNRLRDALSPYLLQHAKNPVFWFPWGPEALALAEKEDKPILLSIGYSACHWCHVMERESFENADIAAIMNEHFVSIKVDREQRPDLDQIYQMVVQLMGRNGGWPLTVFLTPDRRPFFGGTYFPPIEKYGMPAFPTVLLAIAEAYKNERSDILAQANELTQAIEKTLAPPRDPGSELVQGNAPNIAYRTELLAQSANRLGRNFDDVNGGFGSRPKFPNPSALELLLRAHVGGDAESGARVKTALMKMRSGGVYDQLGGGFHRYSTDERWLVPHFEKMLYDNAQLLRLYADGARAFENDGMRDTCADIVSYLEREMTRDDGVFYAAQDADSEGEEGTFFVWTPKEIAEALSNDAELTERVVAYFGVTEEGNFEKTGASVLSRNVNESSDGKDVETAERALFAVREKRPKPFRDEKILTSWNAMTIGALAEASVACVKPEWMERAARAFECLWSIAVTGEPTAPRVKRLALGKRAEGTGFLDDYALLADAALDLYEVTGDPSFAERADALARGMIRWFYRENEGFSFTPEDGEGLIVRPRDTHDGAVPSATAVACRVLARSGERANDAFTILAERELLRLAADVGRNPMGHAHAIGTIDRLVRGAVAIALVGDRESAAMRDLAAAVFAHYIPRRTIVWIDPSAPASIRAAGSYATGKVTTGDVTTQGAEAPRAFVCVGRTCLPPVTTALALHAALSTA